MMIKLTRGELKQFYSNYHGFNMTNQNNGKDGVLAVFNRIYAIQFDPLDVVGRNADLVLFSRVFDYKKEYLHQLLYQDRLLIDGWDKQMGIFKTEFFAHYHHIRTYMEKQVIATLKYRNQLEALELLDLVIDKIKDNGPSQSAKIKLGKAKKDTWGHGNLSSVACDYLWNSGRFGIATKSNVIKSYDLIENLIEEKLLITNQFGNLEQFLMWYVKRRVGNVGIIWNKNGGAWLGPYVDKKDLRTPIINKLVASGELVCVAIEGIKDTFYIRKEDIVFIDMIQNDNCETRFLAPLDNLLWDRKLIKEVYDFEYTWEVYVPVNKRKYGYYVLPVMYQNNIIARFEPKVTRVNDILEINNWWWEDDVIVDNIMIESIVNEFIRLGKFLAVKEINQDQILSVIKKNISNLKETNNER